MKISMIALSSVVLLVFHASTSLAQSQRTFVSGLGNDANPCTRSAPCRNFAQAVSQTSTGGEVVALDSAGYGPFAITQAVSIIAPPGVYAGISVFSGDGIDINAGASDTVVLRGLTVTSQGSTGSGIVFNSGGTLHIEGCVVSGFRATPSAAGIGFVGPGNLLVEDSTARANTFGILVAPSSGTAVASIDHVRMVGGTGEGLHVASGAKVVVRNSIASGGGAGFVVIAGTVSPAELNIENCVASNNFGTGVDATSISGVATVRLSNSTITDNGGGLFNNGVLLSRGNNTVEGNGTDISGTIGSYSAK